MSPRGTTTVVVAGLLLAALAGALIAGPPVDLWALPGVVVSSVSPTAVPHPSPTATQGAATRTLPTAVVGTPMPLPAIDLSAPCASGEGRSASGSAAWHPGFPPAVVPQGLGVQIHKRQGPEEDLADLDMIAAAGFGFIRDDMRWNIVEKVKGQYDFASYDRWMDELARRGIRPLFVLMFSNRLYEEDDRAIRTPGGRAAFAAFAAAAARRYAGRGIVWEVWNEPNGESFWRPQPNLDEYYQLVVETSRAVRQADPTAPIVAPATGLDWPWLEGLFARGLLEHIDGVSIHAARAFELPETAAADYTKLRALMARYSSKPLPIVSSEWGYSSVTHQREVVEDAQARFLARQFLVNLWQGLPLHIWFEWRDDGRTVTPRYTLVRPDRRPKPSYVAAQTLLSTLRGFRFVERVPLGRDEDFLLRFERCPQQVLAVWTTGAQRDLHLRLGTSAVALITLHGERRALDLKSADLAVRLFAEPQYVAFDALQR